MDNKFRITRKNLPAIAVLISIIITGIVGIPYGDPRFKIYAILLEMSYVLLAFFVARGYRTPLYICIALAVLIIIGNSFVSAHINRIITFSRPLNTMILIIGGYVLQGLLIYTSILAIRFSNKSNTRLM